MAAAQPVDNRACASHNPRMSVAPPPPASDPPDPPSPAEVLRWCAAVAPGLWFPADHAARTGVPRECLEEPLWTLRQTGLVEVGDWVRGVGQGYALTEAGRQAVADPPVPPAPDPPAPLPPVGLTAYDRGELTREAFLAPGPAVVGTGLVLAHLGWFFVGLVIAWRSGVPVGTYLRAHPTEVLRRVGAAVGPALLAGEWWRLITAGFAHPGGLPVLGDLFALALLGPVAEGMLGRGRFLTLYLLSALAGAAAAVAVHPDAAVTAAGGAVVGVQAAVIAWLARFRDSLPAAAITGWVRRLAAVAGVTAVCNLAPGVYYEGLLAGGLAGFVTAALLDRTRPGSGRSWRLGAAAGLLLLPVGLVGGLVGMMRHSPDWATLRSPADPLAVIAPDRVRRAEQMALSALRGKRSDAVPEARAAIDGLAAGAATVLAREEPTAPVRAYATEVGRFAVELRVRLAVGFPPTAADEWGLADRRAALERQWRELQR